MKSNQTGKKFDILTFVNNTITKEHSEKSKGLFGTELSAWIDRGVEAGVITDYTPESLAKEQADISYKSKGKIVKKHYTGATAVLVKMADSGKVEAVHGSNNGKGWSLYFVAGTKTKASPIAKKNNWW